MSPHRPPPAVFVIPLLVASGCLPHGTAPPASNAPGGGRALPTPPVVANDGRELLLAADTRALRIGRPEGWVTLQVGLANKGLRAGLSVTRESFLLELHDGKRLPLAAPQEVVSEYHRQRVDLELGAPFEEYLRGRFTAPPHRFQPLDFFPLAASGTSPRRALDLPLGTVTWGYLYFRIPPGADPRGAALLLRPASSQETYVVPSVVP